MIERDSIPTILITMVLVSLPFLFCGQQRSSDFFYSFFNKEFSFTIFPIKAPDEQSLKRALLEGHGPKDPHGVHRYAVTTWNIRWFWPVPEPAKADFAKATVVSDIDVLVPYWQSDIPRQISELNNWQATYLNLLNHELDHSNQALRTSKLIREKLRGLGEQGHSDPQKGNQIASKLLAENREWDREYDRHTEHGKTQGVK